MASKPTNQKKQVSQETTQPAPDTAPVTAPTTIKVYPDVKAKLDELGAMLKTPDYNTTVSRLIEFIPDRLSTNEEVHLIIPAHKFAWLKAKQCCSDATALLTRSVR